MILKMVHLENYAGILNGMGLNEITIDFTKCKHNMLVIKGDNGTGKSTLFKALRPLPDDNSCFVPMKKSRKVIEYFDEYGVIYNFEFIHEVKTDGTRIPAKGYVRKSTGQGMVELNPSGNITSCRDIIYEQLKLDPNFVALSQLSTDDRGLADKKPAERKKFVSSIISSVDAYNNIYKTLSRKSSVFKNMITNITAKIDSIGNIEALKSTMVGLEARIVELQNLVNDANANGIAANSKIKLLDPDGSIMASYTKIHNDIELIKSKITSQEAALGPLKEVYGNISDIKKQIDEITINIATETEKQKMKETIVESKKEELSNLASQKQAKEAKLASIGSEEDEEQLLKAIQDIKNNIAYSQSIFKEMGIDINNMLSKDEYLMGIAVLKDIQEALNNIFSTYNKSIIDSAIIYVTTNEVPDIDAIRAKVQEDKHELETINNLIEDFNKNAELAKRLRLRPDNCRSETCSFIEGALYAKKSVEETDIEGLTKKQQKLKLDIISEEVSLNETEYIYNLILSINRIIRTIQNSKTILSKLPIADILINKGNFLTRIAARQPLHEISILLKYVENANLLEDYKAHQELLVKLEADYKVYSSKKDIISNLTDEIRDLNNQIRHISGIIEEYTETIAETDLDIEIMKNNLEMLNDRYTKLIQMDEYICKLGELTQKEAKYTEDIEEIEKCTSIMSQSYIDRDRYKEELDRKLAERDAIKYKIGVAEEYSKELDTYQTKYDKIETVKFFSSPTTGIQTLFMDLYMNKVISLANQMLQLMFGGTYHLDNFIINETEFRIPCSGGNLPHDDISSMSSSQIACISMILSFALLFQSSTKLNVLKLDEIDGALDSANRRGFIVMLEKMLSILDCDQCVIISHNDELNLENCDVIVLKHFNMEPIYGNIIWEYRGDN